jgi:hypothetical protein
MLLTAMRGRFVPRGFDGSAMSALTTLKRKPVRTAATTAG